MATQILLRLGRKNGLATEYRDERVCVSLCPLACLRDYTQILHTNLRACYE